MTAVDLVWGAVEDDAYENPGTARDRLLACSQLQQVVRRPDRRRVVDIHSPQSDTADVKASGWNIVLGVIDPDEPVYVTEGTWRVDRGGIGPVRQLAVVGTLAVTGGKVLGRDRHADQARQQAERKSD